MDRVGVVVTGGNTVESDLQVAIAQGAGIIVRDPNNMQRIADRFQRQARVHDPPTLFRDGSGLVNPQKIYQPAMLDGRVVDKRPDVNIVAKRGAHDFNPRRAVRQVFDSDYSYARHILQRRLISIEPFRHIELV